MRQNEADGGIRTEGGQTGERTSRQADGGGLATRTGERTNGKADGRMELRTGGWGRTGANGFPKDKTYKLTRQLMWPLEIQRGYPWLTI